MCPVHKGLLLELWRVPPSTLRPWPQLYGITTSTTIVDIPLSLLESLLPPPPLLWGPAYGHYLPTPSLMSVAADEHLTWEWSRYQSCEHTVTLCEFVFTQSWVVHLAHVFILTLHSGNKSFTSYFLPAIFDIPTCYFGHFSGLLGKPVQKIVGNMSFN